ncbi:hypothetical protein ACODT3_19355 [Streptomyces sp. 4.24]|uniref:hypothetical protein n=1 Tax=Streptomyces tritrimontium TaxID=3406573 RepID=UPI003BB575E7
MSEPLITREQAFIEARWALDVARERRDRDRAAGRLDPTAELVLRRIERDIRAEQAAAQADAAHRPAA